MKVFSIVAASLLFILGAAKIYLAWQRDRSGLTTHSSAIYKARQEGLIKSQMKALDEANKLRGGGAWPAVAPAGGRPAFGSPVPKAATPPVVQSTPPP